MPVEIVKFKGVAYPAFQATGNAARFAIPFAKEVCRGRGVDVGASRPEWAFPGAIIADPAHPPHDTATDYPYFDLDYVFSSHCLEHLPDWVRVLDYWTKSLRPGGVMFLYLPDYSQEYWRPWNNTKHVNVLTPGVVADYLTHRGYANVFRSGVDLNNSFTVFGEKT